MNSVPKSHMRVRAATDVELEGTLDDGLARFADITQYVTLSPALIFRPASSTSRVAVRRL